MKKIMIIIDTSRASGRKFLYGAGKYISTLTDWEVYTQPPGYLKEEYPNSSIGFPIEKLDGLLIRDAISPVRIMNIDIPKVINDTQREIIPGTSTIITDSMKIGKVAAEYFLGLGFMHFAFYGFEEFEWSQKRHNGFKDILAERGIKTVYRFENQRLSDHQSITERLKILEWLKQLPRPLCVFACNDDQATSVLEACKIADLSVPEEVAVLGVDNDELVCNLSSPPLSSIELDFEKAGFVAAQHLNDLIQNKSENEIIHVSPIDIIERRSTDILATLEPYTEMTKTIKYINENHFEQISVETLAEIAGLSVSQFERNFKKLFHTTPIRYITKLRLNEACKALSQSDDGVAQIALKTGFCDQSYFTRIFTNKIGITPNAYRKKYYKDLSNNA